MMRINPVKAFFAALIAVISVTAATLGARAESAVVASIKPVHSLVAAVMSGAGEPGLLIHGAGSPHAFALTPAQANLIEEASLIFWVGGNLEAFLEKPLHTIGAGAEVVELIDVPGLIELNWGEDLGSESGENDDRHVDDQPDQSEPDHGEHDHDHGKGRIDPHVWLDPENAKHLVRAIESALVRADPAQASVYRANAAGLVSRLDGLIDEVRALLAPVRGRDYVVFHDAYRYFENRFGLAAAGIIALSPESQPGAERIRGIRKLIQDLGAVCVFSEPQFEAKILDVLIEGTGAQSGALDPLGAGLENGPELYFQLVRNMAVSMRECLSD